MVPMARVTSSPFKTRVTFTRCSSLRHSSQVSLPIKLFGMARLEVPKSVYAHARQQFHYVRPA